MELLLNRYLNLLESIAANPDEHISQLQLHGYVETADYSLPEFLTDISPREMDKLLMEIRSPAIKAGRSDPRSYRCGPALHK